MALSQEFVLADPKKHDLKSFDCTKVEMNQFLSRFAIKNEKLGLCKTWVLTINEQSVTKELVTKAKVAAYFTLGYSSVSRDDIETEKKLPGYPVPMILLARLAVDKNYQGQHLGEKTLITTLRKTVQLADNGLPVVGLILDVLDEDAMKFYSKYKFFKKFTNDPMRLFSPIQVLRSL